MNLIRKTYDADSNEEKLMRNFSSIEDNIGLVNKQVLCDSEVDSQNIKMMSSSSYVYPDNMNNSLGRTKILKKKKVNKVIDVNKMLKKNQDSMLSNVPE